MPAEWDEAWHDLVHESEKLDRVQRERMRQENVLRSYIGGEAREGAKVKEWGWGLDPDHPLVLHTKQHVANLKTVEREYAKGFQAAVRLHPMHDWIKAQPALGAIGVGRLLGSIGNPAWHPLENRPRRLGELNRFCGMDVVDGRAPTRARGQRLHKSPLACTKLWVVADRATKSRCAQCKAFADEPDPELDNGTWTPPPPGCTCDRDFPYRAIYDATRDRETTAIHNQDCRGWHKCQRDAGSPLRPGHKQARGIRITAKAILRDLWTEARRIDGLTD